MFTIKEVDEKVTPKKKNLVLKNISVKDLRLVDTDTGEDISEDVISAIPSGVDAVDFKLSFEIDEVGSDE